LRRGSGSGQSAEETVHKATVYQLKEHNQRLVLRAIYNGRATSRAELAKETGLARPTVSQIVAELIEVGLVQEEGPGESSGGKPPTLLSFIDNAYQIIGLHVGGRNTSGAVTDLRGRILDRARRPTDNTDEESVLACLYAVLDALRTQLTRPLLGIGVSTPGIVDYHSGAVRYSTFLSWQDMPVRARLGARYDDGVPIFVANDTNMAAFGERVFGVGGGVNNMVTVMVTTRGIGAGLILNGEIYHGIGGAAGEIGHMPVADNGVSCVCGRQGCLEAVATGWALLRRAKELATVYPGSVLCSIPPDQLALDDIRHAVEIGDPAGVALACEAGRYLGLTVAILISTMNPQRVVIGGSVSELGAPFFDTLRRTVREHALTLLNDETEILPASLGVDVNILGAVAQVLQEELGVV
jgi:glucokinase-like ROK family protein